MRLVFAPVSVTVPEENKPSNSAGKGSLCVCYVLSYRAPAYIRTRTLLAALDACDGIRAVVASNTHSGLWRYVETLIRLRRVRKQEKPDIYVLGFRGHEIFWLVKALAGKKKPLILDALMSPYAALKDEGKQGRWGRLLAPLVYHLESGVLHGAAAVLTDTNLHVSYYAETFGIDKSKIVSVPVGAVETVPSGQSAGPDRRTGEFTALFYGSFLPLHGVDVIIDAADRLKDLPIHFKFIGGSSADERYLRRRCATLGISRYSYRRWVPFDQLLRDEIPTADLCLGGPFGATPQSSRVVTGKATQCLCLGKATVVGRIGEDFGFVDRENCLQVEQGDPDDLSRAIRWSYENRSRLEGIGRAGRALYQDHFSIRVITGRLLDALKVASAEQAV